jgi:hypothetical protein
MSSSIRPRWAEPVVPLAYDPAGQFMVIGGRTYCHTMFVLTDADTERVRLGYVCINCLEPHEQPYPEWCICSFPMRRAQDEAFERLYEPEAERVGPRTSLADEWEIAKDEVRRGRWARKGIWVPGE